MAAVNSNMVKEFMGQICDRRVIIKEFQSLLLIFEQKNSLVKLKNK